MLKNEKKVKQLGTMDNRANSRENSANDAYKILMENRKKRKEIWKDGR